MLKRFLKIIGNVSIALWFGIIFLTAVNPAYAKIVFKNEFLIEDNGADTFIIDAGDDVTGNVILQFGNSLSETITFDTSNTWFEFSNDISLNENKLLEAEIENVSALPGGAPGLGTAGTGRLVISDTIDAIAPGCTVDPWCPAGTYIWDGAAWISLVGSASSTNLTKVVTVASSGGDYTTIDAAAQYLQTRSGGIMLLSAETHAVTTAVDLTNTIIIGKDSSRTTIEVSAGGQLDSFDTTFKFLTLETTATMTDDMAIDVQSGATSLIFEYVDFIINTAGDVVIDSNEGTAPTLTVKFISSNDAGGSGKVLKTKSSANINTASTIFIDSRSSDNPLELNDWNVTLAGGGSVNTNGIITSVPADSIIVSPNMNLQGAIDSLEFAGNGGLITLLPGTHTISSTLTIEDSNINIVGYGDSSIISVLSITGGDTIGAIQVGAADGTSTVNGVVLKDFKLEVTGTGGTDIHGIRVSGGEDNTIDNVTVQKVSGQSGSGATARIGIQMLDGAAGCTGTCTLTRPVILNSRVFGTSSTNAYFTDGIHVTSDPDISGVFGNDQGAVNILVNGNNVDYVGETAYVFVGVEDASLFNNRASRMAASGNGIGIYIGNADKVNMTANIFSGSLATDSPAINIETFNAGSLKATTNSIFNNNVIDGFGNSGVGFQEGFQIGNATNTAVNNCIFQNNVIAGASNTITVGINLADGADDNIFTNNEFVGGTNPWDTAIDINASTADRNIIRGNQYTNVTVRLADSGTGTLYGVSQHQSTSAPTANDDINDGYGIGTLWMNTSTDTSYIAADVTAGAAVWNVLQSGTTGAKYLWLDIHGAVRTSAGAGTVNGGTSPAINFDAGGNSRMSYSFPIPDDWEPGTDLEFEAFWSPEDATSGNVYFELDYQSWADGETISGSTTLTSTEAAPGTALELTRFTFTIPATALAADDMVNIRFSREAGNVADTYANDINIQMLRINYTGKKFQ